MHYGEDWLSHGFALSEDLPLLDNEFLPPGRLSSDVQRAVGAVDDARPDRWGEKVIRFVDKPQRLSLMEYLYYAGDARELFRRMIFNILIDNTDDHEKNHSLLVVNPFENGRLKLAPAYDVSPTNSGQGYQEFICGAQGRDSTLENAISQCDAFGLRPSEAAAEVAKVIEVVHAWKAHFPQFGVTQRDIDSLAQQIDGDYLLAQRTGFDPAGFRDVPNKKMRTSPFRAS